MQSVGFLAQCFPSEPWTPIILTPSSAEPRQKITLRRVSISTFVREIQQTALLEIWNRDSLVRHYGYYTVCSKITNMNYKTSDRLVRFPVDFSNPATSEKHSADPRDLDFTLIFTLPLHLTCICGQKKTSEMFVTTTRNS